MDLVRKINEFFDLLGCKPVIILKTFRGGEKAKIRYGIKTDIAEYVVIHRNELSDKNYFELDKFARNNSTGIMPSQYNGTKGLNNFISKLKKKDSYEIVYKDKLMNVAGLKSEVLF